MHFVSAAHSLQNVQIEEGILGYAANRRSALGSILRPPPTTAQGNWAQASKGQFPWCG